VGCTTQDLAAVSVPALVLTGDRDMFCPVEVACATYRTLPAGALGIVPNTGHDIAPPVVETMIRFLSAKAGSA
jgi:pimeloyl-ACP methyl ester carboxylesterase